MPRIGLSVHPAGARRLSLEHAVMAVSVAALPVLVVLPLAFLVWGSATAEGRLTLDHFREALGSQLYVQALQNSLVLGAWTAALSVAIGLPLAWAVQKLFPGEGIYAARSDVEPPPGNPPLGQVKLLPVDYDEIEKESRTLKTRFAEIFQ